MNRRQLAFLITLNALISLAIALSVAWAIEARRPDLEELAIIYTPPAPLVIATPQVAAPDTPTPSTSAEEGAIAAPTPLVIPTTGEEEIYIVQAGDILSAIADRFDVSQSDLMAFNNLDNPDFIFSGQRLRIPSSSAVIANTAAVTATLASSSTTPQGIRIGVLEGAGNLLSEAVSIVNDSNIALNLQGWQLEREGGPVYTFGNVSLFPGGNIWVHSRDGSNTSVALYWNQPAAVWPSGAVVRLVNPQGSVVASYVVP